MTRSPRGAGSLERGGSLADHADPAIRTLGYLFQLHALLQTPEAFIFAVRTLQASLTAIAPQLELPAAFP